MLFEDLQKDIIASLRGGDSVRVETLRFLVSAVRNVAIAKYGAKATESITDEDVLDTVKKQVKTHKESVEAFTKVGRRELAAKEQAQLTILESFLPAQISDEELKNLLAPVVASGEQNFDILMGRAMKAVAGKADGGRVAALLKQMLQK